MADPTSPSLISMRELDPSPVESPLSPQSPSSPSAEKAKADDSSSPYLDNKPHQPPKPTSASTSTTLGLHPHTLTRTLLALQKYSTYPFALYLTFHITNTSLLPLVTRNLHSADSYLLLTRPYYQSQLLEPALLLAPLATHLLSGIALRIHRRRLGIRRHGAESRDERRRVPWPKLSTQSVLGYLLFPLVAGHGFVNRWLPLRLEGGSSGVGLRFVAHGFAKHPLVANLGYAALVGVGVWHVVGGTAKWLRLSPEFVEEGGDYGRVKARRRQWVVNGVAAFVAGLWMLGGLGVVGRGGKGVGTGWEIKAWDEIYRSVPVFGGWL
ncbi:hypothetical protein GJ744_004157 [Endocarpon pusillum]|uniref:Mitochondrial adapter protein MCP1 transmembrane domain-containing protein n=1 Tax=Endocarpon pusillum TaxID=364733 RepID=A0A8H7E5U3_9EURO|nr:hypothetical protein GJ744_004157 [Endocarpon pusillum]